LGVPAFVKDQTFLYEESKANYITLAPWAQVGQRRPEMAAESG
jgi:hypothetical protein